MSCLKWYQTTLAGNKKGRWGIAACEVVILELTHRHSKASLWSQDRFHYPLEWNTGRPGGVAVNHEDS